MRTLLAILAASVLVACSSGTRIVYVPAPAPAPAAKRAPAPAPMPMPPVAVTIARVEDSRVLVSTNQPAYLAVFEIVPGRAVSLVYPSSARQRRVALSGSSWLTVSHWRGDDGARSVRNDRDGRDDRYDRDGRRVRRRATERHLYAIASDRPLRLSEAAFDHDYLRTVVGSRAMRDDDPYDVMAALSRRFVPAGDEEDWGEDLFTLDASRPAVVVRVAKIYCPDGSVTYVREDMADRASCPWTGRSGGRLGPMPRPDSVMASSGRPIVRRPDQRGPAVFRVPKPDEGPTVEQQGQTGISYETPRDEDDVRRVKAKKEKEKKEKDEQDKVKKEHEDNGNHYGQEPEAKPESRPETKPESKPDEKSAEKNKDAAKENDKDKDKDKEKAKPEAKGMRSVIGQMRINAKASASDSVAVKP